MVDLTANNNHTGFISKWSCFTNLLAFLEEVADYDDKDKPIDVIYLDF